MENEKIILMEKLIKSTAYKGKQLCQLYSQITENSFRWKILSKLIFYNFISNNFHIFKVISIFVL